MKNHKKSLSRRNKMTESDESYYEESSFVKIFEGVGSIGAIYVCPTYEARDLVLLKCNFEEFIQKSKFRLS